MAVALRKPILINGFPRSGTTYLYRYLKWLSKNLALNEPISSPFFLKEKYGNYKFIKLLKEHPMFYSSSRNILFIYDKNILADFLKKLHRYYIKEISLHFYLDESFINDNWNVFLILRHPADSFLSFRGYYEGAKFFNLLDVILPNHLRELFYYNVMNNHPFVSVAYKLRDLLGLSIKFRSFEEMFVLVWTITNYYAVNSINEKQLIIYENPETYYKLPKWEDWLKIEPLKIKKYKARYYYEKKFLEIAKKLEIYDEFRELLDLLK